MTIGPTRAIFDGPQPSSEMWPKTRPVHSLMSTCHLFFCLPLLLPPGAVPCRMVLARPPGLKMCPYQWGFPFSYDLESVFQMASDVSNSTHKVSSSSKNQKRFQLLDDEDEAGGKAEVKMRCSDLFLHRLCLCLLSQKAGFLPRFPLSHSPA